MKKTGWVDILIGLSLSLLTAALAYNKVPLMESIENKLYDFRMRRSPEIPLSDQIVLVAIDDNSIAGLGKWPWPRGYIARLLAKISGDGPKAIGLDIFYGDEDQNQGLEILRDLRTKYESVLASEEMPKAIKGKKPPNKVFEDFLQNFIEAEETLDNDSQLSKALLTSPGVVLPTLFSIDKPLAEEDNETLDKVKGYALAKMEGNPWGVLDGYQMQIPLPAFLEGASGLGFSYFPVDAAGAVRREAPFIRYKGKYFPSFSLELARVALGLNPDQIVVSPGREIRLGDKKIPLDEENHVLLNFQAPFEKLTKLSAMDVLTEKVPEGAFKEKIVLVGPTALGVESFRMVPTASLFPFNGIIVMTLQNILGGRSLTRPEWAPKAEWGLLLLVGVFVSLILPRMKAVPGAFASLLLLAAVGGGGFYLFVAKGAWVKIFYAGILLVVSYLIITVRRFLSTEKHGELVQAEKKLVQAENVETNKMLGLSFQNQGMLDMAFEKFRRCPVDNAMKELLYNLALDFERKRQFSKAAVVYEHISSVDPKYKDIDERGKAAKAAGETLIVGAGLASNKAQGGTVVMGAGTAKPTLGRYEIQKELGRGAMGVVYLGKDPKINRSVAIKTLRFDEELDAEDAKQIRERFFREAESAGTLNHPHIIRIFDAGEDNEISYIAMELIEGEDLKKYCDKAALLPVNQVLDYVATVADALDYAHAHGVVHRDIKPANIMRLKDGSIRVTDFGIARITASSKTATGTVLGTPSYMSPEQIAGKKVDGRADIFSLGVMLYEMLSGEKPFEGDSIATLLFRIANEPHPDPLIKHGARVSLAVKSVIDKALQKNPDNRYSRGAEMALDIRECLRHPGGIPPMAGVGGSIPSAEKTQPLSSSREMPPVSVVDKTQPLEASSARDGALSTKPSVEHEATMPVISPPEKTRTLEITEPPRTSGGKPAGGAPTDDTMRIS